MIEDVSPTLFDSCNSGIDFLPIEIMNGDKTTGWIADCNRTTKVWCCLWRNFDAIIENKFQNPSMETMKHTGKMCLIYLKLCNKPIPSKIDEKRKSASEHKNP